MSYYYYVCTIYICSRRRWLYLAITKTNKTNIKSRGKKFTNVWTRQSDDGVALRVRLAGEAV